MNRGEIAQIGDAEQLYRRPASVFVARFIGHANLLPATVVRVGAAGVEIDIVGERRVLGEPQSWLQPSQPVTAVIRPEALVISDAAKAQSGVPGHVKSCAYLGDKCEYDVELAGISVQVTKANPLPSDRLAPATAVRVQLPADGIHMLPEA